MTESKGHCCLICHKPPKGKNTLNDNIIIHHTFLLVHDWFKCIMWLNIPQPKLGNIQVILSNFQNCACWEKYLKDNKHNYSLRLVRKYIQIFVLDIICSSALTVLLELHSRKNIPFLEQIMSVDKYSSIIPHQLESRSLICIFYLWDKNEGN